ncbi:MAG: 30S ribosomal protein S15 [Nanoarchaeota archaeon]|nr:30S ribosomal protein S15 [Nanoarchaeota archaeon]
MARMHSGAKGKAGSKRPIKKSVPVWQRYKEKEIELLIIKFAKEGKTPSQIGIILRDTYGIPNIKVATEKRITKILEEKKLLPKIPEDLMALIKRSILIKKHLEENKKDETANRGLLLTESKIRRLVKYYKSSKRLSKDWSYDPDKIRLLIE